MRSQAIDFDRLRSWLDHCDDHLSDMPDTSTFSCLAMRFIDCNTREIVQPLQPCPYYYLSYVWGPSSPNGSLQTDRASGWKLPRSGTSTVIEGVIKVVKGLGVSGAHYLGLDRYCIEQADRHIQIQRMDEIYENACATIVAASERTTSVHCGLPGVGKYSRIQRPRATTQDTIVVSTLPHISTLLEETRWSG